VTTPGKYKAIVWTKNGEHVFGSVITTELKAVAKPTN
jgi:hypothetical protein